MQKAFLVAQAQIGFLRINNRASKPLPSVAAFVMSALWLLIYFFTCKTHVKKTFRLLHCYAFFCLQ
jgi:hypothetical protein